MKPRCESIKKLVAFAPPDGQIEWCNGITAIANRAMTELASQRNRYIHDLWHDGGEMIVRLDTTTRLRRPQSRAPHEVVFGTWHYGETEGVVALTKALKQAADHLRLIVIMLDGHLCEGQPLEPFPPQP